MSEMKVEEGIDYGIEGAAGSAKGAEFFPSCLGGRSGHNENFLHADPFQDRPAPIARSCGVKLSSMPAKGVQHKERCVGVGGGHQHATSRRWSEATYHAVACLRSNTETGCR